jgi:chromate transporter
VRVPLSTVLREWGRLGLIGFGGPPAHVALLRELCVERRNWLSAQEFEDANAACQLLPGPASTQLAIYCAGRTAGPLGAVLGGLAFILPGLAMIVVVAAVALSSSPPDWLRGVGAGAGAAVVAVIVAAGLDLARASLAGRSGGARAWALVYMGAGLVELARRRRPGAAVHAWPALLVLGATGAAALPALAWTALKVGALSYGGGFVIIPLMHGDAVDAQGWMTDAEFTSAVAYGQLTPGPVVQTVAVVGYAAAGLGGALLAAAVAFAPSFLVIALGGEGFQRLRASAAARAFLDGAGPAAVGAVVGAAVPLTAGIEEAWQVGVIAAAALLLALRRPAFAVLVGAAAAGAGAALVGAPLP